MVIVVINLPGYDPKKDDAVTMNNCLVILKECNNFLMPISSINAAGLLGETSLDSLIPVISIK